jgi:hypothetical protein
MGASYLIALFLFMFPIFREVTLEQHETDCKPSPIERWLGINEVVPHFLRLCMDKVYEM